MANMSMSDLGVVTSNIDTTLQFLGENNLLKDGKFCFQCNTWMSHNTDLSMNGNMKEGESNLKIFGYLV